MKILYSIFIVVFLSSCLTIKEKNKKDDNNTTIYAKVWETRGKEVGVVHSLNKYQIMDEKSKIIKLPDSLSFQYVKVTGLLEVNKKIPDTLRTDIQYNYIKYLIKNTQIEIIFDDSTICSIDSMLGRCVEMRRFYNRLQIDKVLDSLVESDSIYTITSDIEKPSTANYFKYAGRKTYFNDTFTSLKYENITEYFVIKNFSCVKDSEYNIELTHVKIIDGVKTERKYQLTGNCNKIFLNPI